MKRKTTQIGNLKPKDQSLKKALFNKKKDLRSKTLRSRKEKIFILPLEELQQQEPNDLSPEEVAYLDEVQLILLNGGDVPFAENSAVTQLSKFFYSNDRFIETFDDQQLYDAITKHYPGILATEQRGQVKRKAILDLLGDIDFMNSILEDYNMTIMDFFRFLFRLCPSIFKGFFVKKVLKALKNKQYVKSVKASAYRFLKNLPKKSSRRYSLF